MSRNAVPHDPFWYTCFSRPVLEPAYNPITRPQQTHHDHELELLIVILNCQSLYDGAFVAIYLRVSRMTVATVATVEIRRRILLLRWRLWTFAP